MTTVAECPVIVTGRLDPELSRWLWLTKWVLALPHYLVLAVLWLGALLSTLAALVAIAFTGRYPRRLFAYNLGVLRWTWRVTYYAYGGLGTDRYPPFSLGEVPDYPARLYVPYPEQLSRRLVLVKSWLLLVPHYLVLAVLCGSAVVIGPWTGAGFITILALIAGFALLFTGRYPRGVFDLVVGLDRWVLRVASYALLLTDAYPPFRLDQGGDEPETADELPAAA